MLQRSVKLVVVCMIAVFSLTGCTAGMFGSQGDVAIVDSAERNKLNTNIDLSDIIAFAENLTNKMLVSPIFSKAKRPPRLVLGQIRQNTHDENLRVSDIYGRIQEVLLNSGQVRVLDSSATSFDYIVNPEISSIVSRSGDGRKKVDYSMVMKLYTISGELKGQWSDDLTLYKAR